MDILSHCSLETLANGADSDQTPPLFANSSTIFLLEYLKSHSLTYLKSKLESSISNILSAGEFNQIGTNIIPGKFFQHKRTDSFLISSFKHML